MRKSKVAGKYNDKISQVSLIVKQFMVTDEQFKRAKYERLLEASDVPYFYVIHGLDSLFALCDLSENCCLTTSLGSSTLESMQPPIELGNYIHKNEQGRRVPGWEDVNLAKLARVTGIFPQHLRQALTGRKNFSFKLIDQIAKELGYTPAQLVNRIDRARKMEVTAAIRRK